MRRFLALCALCVAAVSCLAQGSAPFTIVRPADGAKVRETIHVLFPKNSVDPKQGYVGIFVNGNFIEATILAEKGNYLEYDIDSKALNLPDGPTTIEAVLYENFDEKPRIMDRSSVNVTLANQASIPIPGKGFSLHYHWSPGDEWKYDWQTNVEESTISQEQARLGGHAASVDINSHHAQYIYGMDNTYSNGDALLRMEVAPPKGKHTLTVATMDDPRPRTWFENQMYPIYLRVNSHGWEQYGVLPKVFGSDVDVSGGYRSTDLLADEPLPTLPAHPVKPGDVWESRFQLPDVGRVLDETATSFTQKIPARAEFVDVEWEMGYPCAKIHQTFSIGNSGPGAGANKIKTNAQSIDETYWFALDQGVIVKLVRTMNIDRKVGGEAQPMGSSMKGSSDERKPPRKLDFAAGVDIVIPQGRRVASAGGSSAGGGVGGEPPPQTRTFNFGNNNNNQQQTQTNIPLPPPQPEFRRVTFTETLTLER